MNAASVKAKLKNISDTTGKNFQELLIAYGLERTIYRLSVSAYRKSFILKGGIFLYALSNGNYSRATTDIDFLAKHISNDLDSIKCVFTEIFSIEADDPMEFDTASIVVKPITEFKEYHGVNISTVAYLERTRIPISIDIGFGDVIYPDEVEMEFPCLVSEKPPVIMAYSLDTSIAEKFEAIVSLGYDNSRFKDFYDIYVWMKRTAFDGETLAEACRETFTHRQTSLERIVAFEPGFADDAVRASRWKAFAKKKKILLDVTLEETIEGIREFMVPVIDAIVAEEKFEYQWSPEEMRWNRSE